MTSPNSRLELLDLLRRRELLDLLRRRSFRRGEVTLASGRKSDFFIDCKRTVLTGAGMKLAGEVLLDEITATERPAAVAAVPLGGCPLVDAIAVTAAGRDLPLEVLYVRPERKDHGTTQKIEGAQNLEPGASVVLVEDVVTTGSSSLRAVEGLREAGFDLLYALILVDRLEGGREQLEAAGVTMRSVFTRSDFVA